MKAFIFPEKVVWDKETYRDNYGKLIIEPLERGYGTTLGNTLRRVLLSSIEGVAITAIKINGVSHEFTTIKGVKEDVVDIVLNLKQVSLKPIISEFPHLTEEIEISDKEEICAGDLINNGSAEVINKGLHIATLLPGTTFKFQIEISKGRGYLPCEKMKFIRPSPSIGTILIDALFSPVRKVSFNVENTRVGQFVDYEKLILEVWTTSAITPRDTIKEAVSLINQHCFVVGELQKIGDEEIKEKISDVEKITVDLECPISELKLNTRIVNGLSSAKIQTLNDLLSTPRENLDEIKNLGKKSIFELENVLREMGLKLKTKQELDNEAQK